jgi:hypothetical protein
MPPNIVRVIISGIMFICNKFNDAVRKSESIASKDWVTASDKLERIRKEEFVA